MATGGSEEISLDEANRTVDDLVKLIEQRFTGFKINEIIKGGSLGHGTAVFGHFDVDLVIYSDDVRAEQIVTSGYGYYLRDLHTFLQEELGNSYIQTEQEKEMMTDGRSIQFTYKGKVPVDLLVSPNWKSLDELYVFLSDKWPRDNCEDYTIFASKWQVQFFKNQPPQVKEYICRAKAWRNQKWPVEQGGAGEPSSYLMSLLVVKAYERGGPERITAVLKDIVSGSPDIIWDRFYTVSYGGRGLLSLPVQPRIIDPANPVNNIWKTGFKNYKPGEYISDYKPGDGNAKLLRERIDTIDLSQPDGMARSSC